MRKASGEASSSENTGEDVHAIVASLRRQGFAIVTAEPPK
jgi:hypothetical protein